MAEEPTTTTDEEAFGKWLDGLNTEPDEDEPDAEPDEDPLEIAKRAERKADAMATDRKIDDIEQGFEKHASETAKRVLATLRTGDETPKQLKAKMELASVKAKEIDGLETPKEDVETKAAELAKEAYGVGPISPGQASAEDTPQQVFDRKRERIRKAGDTHTAYELFRDLPSGIIEE
jgi:hypothetical protein